MGKQRDPDYVKSINKLIDKKSSLAENSSEEDEENIQDDGQNQNLIDFNQNVIISYPVTQTAQNELKIGGMESDTSQSKSRSRTSSSSSKEDEEESDEEENEETEKEKSFRFRKIYFAVKSQTQDCVLVSAGTNGYLDIWNSKTHRDSHSTMLEALPSYLDFSDDDSLLAVGLRNGKVLLFTDKINTEFELLTQVQGDETYE